MPVVTIEPVKVNTIPYEEGREDTIVFTITNHGLIRADNVRFNLPTDHPLLNFQAVRAIFPNAGCCEPYVHMRHVLFVSFRK